MTTGRTLHICGILTAFAVGLLLLDALVPLSRADDWPQWRGPQRNGITPEKLALEAWPQDGSPKVAWRAQVGKGHSAVVVRGGRAFTMGWDGRQDTLWCLAADTGRVLWSYAYPCGDIVQWSGPRATPTVDGDMVYTLSQHGLLCAVGTADGKLRWKRQLSQQAKPDDDYGFAWSPLVVGRLLILSAGEGGLALDKSNGEVAWGNDQTRGACISPVPYEYDGRQGVIVVSTNEKRDAVYLVGVDPASGRRLFRSEPWKENWGAACADLVVEDGHVFLSTAETFRRCARWSIAGETTREDWSNANLANYTSGTVLLDGHLYAVSQRGLLTCLDWKTGEQKWVQRGFDERGTLIAAGGRLVVQCGARGEVAVVEPSPEGYRPLRRTKVFEGPGDTYTAPVLAGGRLYCRSYAGEVVCLDLRP